MNYKTVLIIVVQLGTFAMVNAQDSFKLAGVSSVFYPQSAIKDNTQNASLSIIEHAAFINIPSFPFKNKQTAWINGLSYIWLEIDRENSPMAITSPKKKQLQVLSYQTIIAHTINESWNIMVTLKPTLASDFKEKLNVDDFVFQGAVLVTKTMNQQFKIGGGLVSNMRFGKPIALPVISLNYTKGKHYFGALLPIQAAYKYSIGKKEKLIIGLKQVVNGGEFNLSPAGNFNVIPINKARYTRLNIGTTVAYKIAKMISINLYGGVSMCRQYDLNDEADNLYELDIKESPFVQLGIVLVPPKKKK